MSSYWRMYIRITFIEKYGKGYEPRKSPSYDEKYDWYGGVIILVRLFVWLPAMALFFLWLGLWMPFLVLGPILLLIISLRNKKDKFYKMFLWWTEDFWNTLELIGFTTICYWMIRDSCLLDY
ncbi:MAG: hypothetical protein H7644_11850 [Candidatus Heimdallarchaeota archaeon]|nr:hypothetical protein [Candidatus Heimdallarchaeota archaeon]